MRTIRLLILPTAVLAALGWTYQFRQLGWLNLGPRAGDALPLLQLAGFDGQPIARLLLAWVAAGTVAGFVLARVSRARRGLLAAVFSAMLLAACSEASFALSRNLRLGAVLGSREPGAGVWIESALFAAGCLLPRASGLLAMRRRFSETRLRHIALSRGEHRHAAEHQHERD
jgi:hypothetical protein